MCSGGGGAQHIISKVSSLQNHSVQPAREATSKAGQGRRPNTSGRTKPQRKFVPIEDARRVWGTLRSTTTSAVTNAIKCLTPGTPLSKISLSKGSIKQTKKVLPRIKWWFVIRGDKHNLVILEKEWSKYPTQIGWKLEPAFCYDNSAALFQHSNQMLPQLMMLIIVNTNSTSTD